VGLENVGDGVLIDVEGAALALKLSRNQSDLNKISSIVNVLVSFRPAAQQYLICQSVD
jgi:hypothetical protein